MSDINSNFADFPNPVNETAVLRGDLSIDEESVGSPVLETLRPPVIDVIEESVTLPVPVYCCVDSGGGQLDAVNNPCLVEGEGEPTSCSSACVEIHPGQGQAAFPISASGDVPDPLCESSKVAYLGGGNSAFSVPGPSHEVAAAGGVSLAELNTLLDHSLLRAGEPPLGDGSPRVSPSGAVEVAGSVSVIGGSAGVEPFHPVHPFAIRCNIPRCGPQFDKSYVDGALLDICHRIMQWSESVHVSRAEIWRKLSELLEMQPHWVIGANGCGGMSESLARQLLDHVVNERGKLLCDFNVSLKCNFPEAELMLKWSLKFVKTSR